MFFKNRDQLIPGDFQNMAYRKKQYYLTDNSQLINASATGVLNLSKQLTAKPSPIGQHLIMQLMTEKMGPGGSAHLHIADEFIYINKGINGYTGLLKSMMYCLLHNPANGKTIINLQQNAN